MPRPYPLPGAASVVRTFVALALLVTTLVLVSTTLTPAAFAQTAPEYGPSTGHLVIAGGGNLAGSGVMERFIALAGGPGRTFVIVPTAAGTLEADGTPTVHDEDKVLAPWKALGVKNVRMLHAHDPRVADTEAFVAPLRGADAVWFDGGRQWRIVDAYANTRTLQAFRDVLARGGVMGGSSAGATIQGAYLVRGATAGPEIVMTDEPNHQDGFAFLRRSAIDQHIDTRNRWDDLIPVMRKFPDLLGIGLAERTAAVVTGDRFEVIGEGKVAVHDTTRTPAAGEKPYVVLNPGDQYDMQTRRVISSAPSAGATQQNRIDVVSPLAPELAAYGTHAVGVRTLTAVDRNRPDILNTKQGGPTARYDRTLVLEVWYPAALAAGQTAGGEYRTITRDPKLSTTLHGRAVRDAALLTTAAPFPLVVISHGYPGNRFLMGHLAENLASKGFVVVSIDHADSTYDDQQAFASTLYNRSFDQLFVLNEMARLAAPASATFLSGRVDTNRTGIVGYSMGGYGVVNVIGGGYSEASVTREVAPPNGLLGERAASNPSYRQSIDPRIKAAIAIGPWGMQAGLWDAEGLRGIRTPVLFVAGSADEVSGYERGTRALFEGAVNADRYLLTFVHAGHNAAAPYPAPVEALEASGSGPSPFTHYGDPVWDTVRMNNILQHFATAYFDRYLKDDETTRAYFEVVPKGSDAVYAVDREGNQQPTHTYWKGFKRGTAVGLVLEHGAAAGAPQEP